MKLRSRSILLLLGVAGALAGAAFPRDEFLRGSSLELSTRERAALDDLVGELGNPDPVVRNRAVGRIHALGRAAVPALGETLRRSNDPKLLRNVCLALGTIDDPACAALLEREVIARDTNEDVLRAALFATGRGHGYPSSQLAESLRRLCSDASLATIREAALLASGARGVAGLGDLAKGPAAPAFTEKLARVRGCIVIALAEADDAGAVEAIERALDPKKTRDEMLRRAALYAAARSGKPALLEPLLKMAPDTHEVASWCVALGAYQGDGVVETLGRALKKEGDRALEAVFSLANVGTPAANDWLRRAVEDEFGDAIAEAACVAVARLVDEKRFLPGLRAAATGSAEGPKAGALLTLARMADGESAAAVAKELPRWRDPRLITRGLLLCGLALETPIEEVLPEPKVVPLAELWRTIFKVQHGTALRPLIQERLQLELTRARGHWLLRRDDRRTAVVRELLELDKVVFLQPKNSDGKTGDGAPPPPSGDASGPPSGGGDGSGSGGGDGGGNSGGNGSGSGSGNGSGNDSGGGSKGGFDGLQGQRRGKQDTARFELDLRQWLEDFPLFKPADPFGR